MGNKEFRDGFFSVKDGISLLKFPMVDEVRVVFLLYHMKSIPKAIKMPVTINKAKIHLGNNVHLSSQEFYQKHPWTWLVISIL